MSEIVTLQEIGETFYSLGPSVCPGPQQESFYARDSSARQYLKFEREQTVEVSQTPAPFIIFSPDLRHSNFCCALKTPEASALLTHHPRRDAVIVARLYG